MKYLNVENWNRKEHFNHYRSLEDPYFSVTANVDVTKAFYKSKKNDQSFFVTYLHACLKALNSIENFKYRIKDEKVVIYNTIHASSTIARNDHTFGFSFIYFNDDFFVFNQNFLNEKKRVLNSTGLFSPINSDDCIYCSALPWVSFTGHKEPYSGQKDESIPKFAFGKMFAEKNKLKMPISVAANHALVDGYHVGLFFDKFQEHLDKNN